MELNIEAIEKAAAEKVADEIMAKGHIEEVLEKRIIDAVNSFLTEEARARLSDRIEDALSAEVEKILSSDIVPVDMWGEPTGDPTNIRDQIAARAKSYWEEKVRPDQNNQGRFVISEYGGEPRHKAVYKAIMTSAFEDAVRQNVTEIVLALKDALKTEGAAMVANQVEKHIKTPTRR